jgi:DNA-binding FadR family transcriptional regulator
MQTISTQNNSRKTSSSQAAMEMIRASIADNISSGIFKEGDRLPTEREIAITHGISRAVVRKSLDALEREGLITRKIGRGTFVAYRNPYLWDRKIFSEISPADLTIARLMIEPSVAEYATVHATEAELRAIKKCLDDLLSTTDPLEYDHYDGRLHTAIAAAAHNEFITYVVGAISEARRSMGWKKNTLATFSMTRQAIHNEDHQSIVKALLARDPILSGEAMRRHILRVIKFMSGTDN